MSDDEKLEHGGDFPDEARQQEAREELHDRQQDVETSEAGDEQAAQEEIKQIRAALRQGLQVQCNISRPGIAARVKAGLTQLELSKVAFSYTDPLHGVRRETAEKEPEGQDGGAA